MIKLIPFFEYVNGPGNDEDSRIVTLKGGAPKWLSEAIQDCHGGRLPNNSMFE